MKPLLLFLVLIASCYTFENLTKETIEKFSWPEPNYHGWVPIGKEKGNDMFYWWFPSRRSRATDPLILWLTGGPGCSSELALFVENGPFTINKKTLEVGLNRWSWNNEANIVYIDQPLGTGFSNVKPDSYVKDEDTVAKEIYEFLLGFLTKFPEFKGRDFYIMGESYGGHFVPHAGNYVYNQRNADLPLRGIAIGNGLPNPWVQYEAYAEYALMNRIIGFSEYLRLLPAFRQCETMMQYDIDGGREMCDGLYGSIVSDSVGFDMAGTNSSSQKFNNYDITKPCIGPLCYNFKHIDDFLNSKAIKADLGVSEGNQWSACDGKVGAMMAKHDWRKNAAPKMADMMNGGLTVWMYHGDLDIICNWVGGEMCLNGVDWYGSVEFGKTQFTNAGYGLKREWNNVRFIKFSNAGHMVPMDQPENAFKMLKEFLGQFKKD